MKTWPEEPNPYTLKSRKVLYEGHGKRFIVDELELDGIPVEYSYLERQGGVEILALDENDQAALIGQWRYPLGKYSWELPAGGIEEGEEVLATAKRELLEEAGVTAEEWIYLGSMNPNSSHSSLESHAYLARGLSKGSMNPDEDEKLQLMWRPWTEVLEAAYEGQIMEGLTLFAIFKAQAYLRNEE